MQKLTRRLRDCGVGLLITDHNVRETPGICDRACIVNDGEVIAAGGAGEAIVHERAAERVKQVHLGRDFRI